MEEIVSKMVINLEDSVSHLSSLTGGVPGLWLAEIRSGSYSGIFIGSLKAKVSSGEGGKHGL